MNYKTYLVSVGFLLSGLICAPYVKADTSDNLLVNGGFNAQGFPYPNNFNLILSPWSWSGSIAYTWANNSQNIALGPGATVDVGGYLGFRGGLIYQDVATTPGQAYELTIIAHSRGTTAGTWLQPLWDGSQLPLGLAKYWEWTAIRYELQAMGSSTRVTIMPAPNNDGPTWIDSVNLVAVTEPSALALLTVCGGFFLRNVDRSRRRG